MIENPHEKNIKSCVIIFNLGGPNSKDEVGSFLFNLFFDKRIITLPKIPRFFLSTLISFLRKKKATEIYNLIGGKSPIKENTEKQAIALQNELIEKHSKSGDLSVNWRVFYAMRHSSPKLDEIIDQISEFDPQNIVLMPLYPQYSTTTTESFFDKWSEIEKKYKNGSKIFKINDYHDNKIYIKACSEKILSKFKNEKLNKKDVRFLFSAHGLPESIIKNGDPYKNQMERCFSLIKHEIEKEIGEIDAKLCYQSKVGLQKWLTPTTEGEILQSIKDKKGVVIFPIAFTSEHSETLVELDIELREIATKNQIKSYTRVETLMCDNEYIKCLSKLAFEKIFN